MRIINIITCNKLLIQDKELKLIGETSGGVTKFADHFIMSIFTSDNPLRLQISNFPFKAILFDHVHMLGRCHFDKLLRLLFLCQFLILVYCLFFSLFNSSFYLSI